MSHRDSTASYRTNPPSIVDILAARKTHRLIAPNHHSTLHQTRQKQGSRWNNDASTKHKPLSTRSSRSPTSNANTRPLDKTKSRLLRLVPQAQRTSNSRSTDHSTSHSSPTRKSGHRQRTSPKRIGHRFFVTPNPVTYVNNHPADALAKTLNKRPDESWTIPCRMILYRWALSPQQQSSKSVAIWDINSQLIRKDII